MPQIFKFGPYRVFFWSNENEPLEPIHVHISIGKSNKNSTKIWITKTSKCILANNNSNIPEKVLKLIIRMLENNIDLIKQKWLEHFDEITYFCWFLNYIDLSFLHNKLLNKSHISLIITMYDYKTGELKSETSRRIKEAGWRNQQQRRSQKIIENAGMELTDEELDSVAGGLDSYGECSQGGNHN